LKARRVNGEWHKANRMPANATRVQRVEWHAEHAVVCGCRPVPAGLAEEVRALNGKRVSRTN
jgi:hypothetical protein